MNLLRTLGVAALAAPNVLAQGATLSWSPAATLPGFLQSELLGPAGRPFVGFLDQSGGPRDLLGVRVHLGLTPALTVLEAGVLDGAGRHVGLVLLPPDPSLAGLALYHQSLVVDASAPNGVFRISNPQSSCLYQARGVLVVDFRSLSGLTGSFDTTVAGRLQGGPVVHRSVSTVDPQGALFGMPILSPLNPNGARLQMVYRPRDLGSRGEEELITGIEWKVHRYQALLADQFQRIAIDLGHTDITPDYTIDPFSALPMFPDSGLTTSFAGNYRPGTTGQRVYDGPYALQPANLQPGGYLPYPAFQSGFSYNGVDSLLVDVRTFPSPAALGVNGCEVNLMVTSSPMPAARALAAGAAGRPLDPATANVATNIDNAMHDLRVHLARVKTFAQSAFVLGSGVAAPDYQSPIVAASTPSGTSFVLEFRGAISPLGTRATPWSTSVDVADGYSYLQFRATLVGNAVTNEVPSIDTLVVPSN